MKYLLLLTLVPVFILLIAIFRQNRIDNEIRKKIITGIKKRGKKYILKP